MTKDELRRLDADELTALGLSEILQEGQVLRNNLLPVGEHNR